MRSVSRFSGLWQAAAMSAAPPSPAQFLTDVLNAVHEITGRRPPPTWTHVDKVQHKLGTDNVDAIHAAIRLAVAKGWMRADGDPPASVTITVTGIKLLKPAGA